MKSIDASVHAYRLRCVRIGVLTSAFTLALLGVYPFLPGHLVEARTPYLAIVIAGLLGVVGVNLLPWPRLLEGPWGIRVFYAWSVLDIALISLGALVAGGTGSEWVLVYSLTTIFFAASYPIRGQLALLAFTGVCYVGIAAIGSWDLSPASLFFRLGMLVLVEFIASFLSSRLIDEMSHHAAALAVSNRRADLLAIVAEAARNMSTTEPESLLRTVVSSATRAGFDGSEICMFDEPAGVWVQQYHHGMVVPGYMPWGALDSGLAGRVWSTKATIVIDDYGDWIDGLDAVKAAGFRTTVGSPVWCGDELAGVLIAGITDQRQLEPHEVEAIDLLASQAGAALVVTRRYAERQAHEVVLRHQATHDPLTALPNRALLFERLRRALSSAARDGSEVGLLFIDLDRFKNINDSLGHDAGDEFLESVARRLQSCLRPGDTLARYGGDEFAIILDRMSRAGACRVADRVLEAMVDPIVVGDRALTAACSIGISIRSGQISAADLLRESDVAMFKAKQAGGGRWACFEDAMHTDAQRRLDGETELRDGVEAGEFVLHYQPIVSLDTGRIDEVEALVRWNHPENGLVFPDSFIAMAERTGLIVPLGRWVLQEACHQVRRWAEIGIDLGVSVNLSVAQFQEDNLLDDIAAAIADAGISSTRLTLEVTESIMVAEPDVAAATMHEITKLGVSISLDDFGQGYAFLGHLKQFPTSVVKIDRAFVDGLTTSPEDQAIVRAVVSLSHDLGKTVVAEGVETTEHFHEVRRLGCDRIQGNLISKPVPAASITSLLAAPASFYLPTGADVVVETASDRPEV